MAAQPLAPDAAAGPLLTTARLTLTPIAVEDAFDIVALHRNPRVSGLLVDGIPDTLPKAIAMQRWNAPMAAAGYGTFAVRRHGETRVIGLFSLAPFGDAADLLEFGGRLLPEAWRGGIGVEAGAALIDHAFGALGRDRLVSAFHPDNRSAPAALRRLGFGGAAATTLFGRPVMVMTLTAGLWAAQGRRVKLARAMRPDGS